MSTCAVEIRQFGNNRLDFKSFKVISGMSQRLSPKRPLCCPQPSLFTVCLNCSHSFNKAQTKQLLCNNVHGELAEAQLGAAHGQGIRTM